MEYHSIPVILFFTTISTLLRLSTSTTLQDTISVNQTLKDGETIVSPGQIYELGFFSPGKSKNRYLGIWYKKASTGTVVWVANRNKPITDTSAMFQVSRNGNLVILTGGNTVIWSSATVSESVAGNYDSVVQLLDTGNLVVRVKNSANENLVWQSFDYPGDTLLPGMKFGKDLVRAGPEYSDAPCEIKE